MIVITFYAKPRCATNQKQRQLLEAAGHHVIVKDLVAEPWTAERLRQFFEGLPVPDWFNRAAPRIKSGGLDTARLSAERALQLMLADPLLIRRPLMEIGDARIAGFDPQRLQTSIDLAAQASDPDIERCSRDRTQGSETHTADVLDLLYD